MQIILKRMKLENFKLFNLKIIDFTKNTKVFAQNYKGKSTIADGFFWNMFGKSSTGNSEGKNFHPRRKEDGIDVDRVPVIVELTLDIDGREVVIRKEQEQKWVRKRGTDFETYEGDANKYFWNEVEVKESEHKKRVAEIIDEDLFKKLTNPHAFISMKQDEQKKFLTEKVAQITDDDVFNMGGFEELKAMAERNTLEEIKAINKKALQGYNDQMKSIPDKIAERSRDIETVDFAEQELALATLKEQLDDIENRIADVSKSYDGINDLKREIAEFKSKLQSIEQEERNTLLSTRRDIQTRLDNATYKLTKATRDKVVLLDDIKATEEKISSTEVFFDTLKKRYAEEKAKEYDECKNICPSCGQGYPEDKRAELIKNFEDEKEHRLKTINVDGAKISGELKNLKVTLETDKSKLAELDESITKLTADQITVKAEVDALPTEINLSSNKEYTDLQNTITALEFSLRETMESLADTDTIKANLNTQKAEIQTQINEVNRILARKQVIDDARDRVDELHQELKKATTEAARCEKVVMTLDNFEKVKTQLLTAKVNDQFRKVTWSFERQQKNGGTEQYCTCTINGMEYGENTTSTTEGLMAGLDIIVTLQKIYGVYAPIFIDNKERYNDHNVPEMDCQMITLSVSDDVELRVDNE